MFFKKRYANAIDTFNTELEVLNTLIKEIESLEQELNNSRQDSQELIIASAEFISTISNTPQSFKSDYHLIESSINSENEINNIESITHQLQTTLNISDILLTCSAAGLSIFGLSSITDNELISNEKQLYENSLESIKSVPQGDETTDLIVDSALDSDSDDSNQKNKLKEILAFILAVMSLAAVASRCIGYITAAKKILSETEKVIYESTKLKTYLTSVKEHIEKIDKTQQAIMQILDEVQCNKHADFIKLSSDEQKRICDLFNLTVGLSKELQVIVEVPK